jgi:hypothetical protein
MVIAAMVVDGPPWARMVVGMAMGVGELNGSAALVVVPGLGLVVREY